MEDLKEVVVTKEVATREVVASITIEEVEASIMEAEEEEAVVLLLTIVVLVRMQMMMK